MPDLIQQMRAVAEAVRAKLPANTPVGVNAFYGVNEREDRELSFMVRIGDVIDPRVKNFFAQTLKGVRDEAVKGAAKWCDKRAEDEATFRRLARELGHYLPPGGE